MRQYYDTETTQAKLYQLFFEDNTKDIKKNGKTKEGEKEEEDNDDEEAMEAKDEAKLGA
jgi:U3 small nucleolar ribonucleoprotein component